MRFVTRVEQSWQAVLVLGLAAAAHQAWSTNIFTVLSDLFPRKALGSVVGIGGMIGSACTIAAFYTLGHVIQKNNADSYLAPFLVAGLVYLVVLGLVQLLVPRLTPVDAARLDG